MVERLAEAAGIAAHRRQIGRQGGGEANAGGDRGGSRVVECCLHEMARIDRRGREIESAALDPRHVQHGVDEHGEALAGGQDGACEFGEVGGRRGRAHGLPGQELGEADDRVERRQQLMADGGEEARLGGAARLRLLLGAPQLRLGGADIGDVGVGVDVAAGARRAGAHLEDAALAGHPLIDVGVREVACAPATDEGLALRAGAVLAEREQGQHGLIGRAAAAEQIGRQTKHPLDQGVVRHQPVVLVEKHDAVLDVGQHLVHVGKPPGEFRLGVRERGHVGHRVHPAAAGQRRRADLDRPPVRTASPMGLG